MALPDVTIVIVAHSVRGELERCLASIDPPASLDVQVVLVDNASSDDTLAWAASAHPSVTLVPLQENIGVAARDHGLRLARGRYTMFLDSDAALTPSALPRMVEALDEHPSWGLIGPRLVYDDGSPQPSARRFPPLALPLMRRPPLDRLFENGRVVRRHLMADVDPRRARRVFYVLGACQLFRTDLARAAGAFGDRIFFGPDDIEWCIRIRDAGGEIVYFPHATVVHSYRRSTRAQPLSATAFRHLVAYFGFHWRYRGRRKELAALGTDLDRRPDP